MEYKMRHDNISRMIHWDLCDKYAETAYGQIPEGAIHNYQILWDVIIQCDPELLHRKALW